MSALAEKSLVFIHDVSNKQPPVERSLRVINEIEYQSFLNWWRVNWQRFENLPFRLNSQVELFIDQWKKEGLDTAFSQLRMDLFGYYLEYIKQEGIIPFSLRVNSSGRVVGEFYGNKPITDIVDPRERDGIVLKTIVDLERRLINLREGEIIFRISPSGWTGLNYDYTETQAQVFWKDKDRFRGLTIRTQINLSEILELLSDLNVAIPSEFDDEKEIIKYITSLNITLPYSSWQFIQFLAEKFANRDHRGENLEEQIKNWRENDGDFARFDEISGLVGFLEKKVVGLVNSGCSAEEVKEELRSLIGFVLMGMVGDRKDNRGIYHERNTFHYDSRFLPAGFYNKIFDKLMSLPGCAGGGGSVGEFVLTPFGTVGVVQVDKYGSREFECPHCHKNVVRPKDQLLEKCPHCGGDVSC
ncbi:MAG: zinc ribbon domain-containing protein [Microgenomates group bacterium]